MPDAPPDAVSWKVQPSALGTTAAEALAARLAARRKAAILMKYGKEITS